MMFHKRPFCGMTRFLTFQLFVIKEKIFHFGLFFRVSDRLFSSFRKFLIDISIIYPGYNEKQGPLNYP